MPAERVDNRRFLELELRADTDKFEERVRHLPTRRVFYAPFPFLALRTCGVCGFIASARVFSRPGKPGINDRHRHGLERSDHCWRASRSAQRRYWRRDQHRVE